MWSDVTILLRSVTLRLHQMQSCDPICFQWDPTVVQFQRLVAADFSRRIPVLLFWRSSPRHTVAANHGNLTPMQLSKINNSMSWVLSYKWQEKPSLPAQLPQNDACFRQWIVLDLVWMQPKIKQEKQKRQHEPAVAPAHAAGWQCHWRSCSKSCLVRMHVFYKFGLITWNHSRLLTSLVTMTGKDKEQNNRCKWHNGVSMLANFRTC